MNNAGYGLLGYFEEMSEQSIRAQIETNVFGTMKITRAILPVMQQQSGFVVTVSSTSGIKSVAGGSVYSASKFALEGWSEGMNIDLKPFRIHFMLLEPGAFRTDFANEETSMKLPDRPPARIPVARLVQCPALSDPHGLLVVLYSWLTLGKPARNSASGSLAAR